MASEMSNAKGDGRKGSKNKKTVCDKQEEKLKRLGMYEKGMTAAETTEMLSIIEESKKGAAAGSNVKICKESDVETSSDDTALVCLSPELFTDDEKQPKASGPPKRNDAVILRDKKSTTGFDPWLGSGHGESRSPQLRIKQRYKYKVQKSSTSDGLKSRLATAKILKHLENYYQRLHFVQRQSLNYMKWGEPVIVGRHMEDTIDRYTRSRKKYFKAVDDQEVGKKTEEPSPKTGDDDDEDFQPSISWRVNRNTSDDDDKDFQPSSNKRMDRNTAGLRPEKPNGSSLKPKRFYSTSPSVNFNLETTDKKSDDEVSSGEDNKLPELETGAAEKQAASHHLQYVFRAKTSPKRQTEDDEISDCQMSKTGNTVYRKWREAHSSIEQRLAVLGGNVKVKSNKIGLGAHGEKNDWLSRRSPSRTYSGSKRSKLGIRDGPRKKLSLTQVSKLMPSPSQDADENSKCLAMKPHPNKRQRIENVDEENVDSNTSAPRSTNPSSPKVFDLASALDQDVANGKSDVPCPLCGVSFAWNIIEDHAADCEGLKTDLALETRTPKNHNRCYICRGAFPEATYRDHVRRCIATRRRLPQSPPSPPKTLLTPACPSSSRSNSSSTKLLRRLDDHQLDDDVSLPSPVISRVPPKKRALLNSKISNGNISLSHVTTSPFATFHPISKQPDSAIDFKNQFSKRQTLVRKVITKKRTTKKKRKRKSSRRSQRL